VQITEQLDPNLDWSTFQLGSLGFGSYTVPVPSGRTSFHTRVDATATLGVLVDISAGIDLATGLVTWTFTSLDPKTLDLPMDPLAGFLPPNQNAPAGQGFVNYTVHPKAGLATGTRINAQATVVFDVNAPINTAALFDTADTGAPTSSVQALPAFSKASFPVSWSGQDDPGGSGIASYNIYVSDNGGTFTLWQAGTPQTSATYPGQPGHTYGFYSVATDNVGNVQPTPTAAQATTMLPLPSSVALASDHASGAAYGRTVTITATVSASPGTPAGSVQFSVDGSATGSPVTLTGGSASIALSSLTAGAHNITATFTSTVPGIGDGTTANPLPQTVNPVPLAITADNQSMVYGAALPALTVHYTGFVNGDTAASLTTAPTVTTTATASSGVSTYPITASGAVDPNYTISYVPGTLTITPALLTITAENENKVYGAGLPPLTAHYTGFVNGDTASVVGGAAGLTTPANAASGVGSYPIMAAQGTLSAANYTFAFVNGTLTVTPATLTVIANNAGKLYGAALPSFTDTITGFVNGDASSVVSGPASLTTSATAASGVGSYPITAALGSLSAANYTFTFVNGTLTVTPATLTVTANNAGKVYGQTNPAFTNTLSGFVNGDSASVVSGAASLTTSATAASGVGSYPITAALGSLSAANYTFTFANGTLTVTPATLTITADNPSKVYGAGLPTLTVHYSGFVNGDTAGSLTTAPTVTTTATAASGVGAYPVMASGAVDPNYTITFVPGTLTVTPATLTVTADNASKVYGAALPTLTDTITGFVNGDSASAVSGAASLTTAATAASGVGSYPITAALGSLSAANYTFTFANGALTVTLATLTVTANNASKVYGQANPAFTDTITGFVNGDTAGVVGGAAGLTTSATAASGVGSYPITAAQGTLSAANYTFTFVNGTLTVTPATLTITADNPSKVYGAGLPTLTVHYSGFVNGDTAGSLTSPPTVMTTATATSGVGTYPISVSGAVDPNYTISFVPGTLTVTAAALTITANDQTKVYGTAVPSLTVHYTGFVNGDTAGSLTTAATVTTPATAASGVGSYPITASGAADPNYLITFVPGTLTVTPAPLRIRADDHAKVYGAALPALTVEYTGLVNGDTPSGLTQPPTVTTPATAASPVGTSPITVSGAADPNYTITLAAGTLTITPAPLTVTADDQSKVYGAAVPSLTAHYSGFVNGDTASSLTTAPTVTTPATAASGVGTYPITASGAADPNYILTFVPGTLTVTPAPLTIAADNQTMVAGTALPALTVHYAGFVNGDTQASLSSPAVVSTSATTASQAGSYAITVSGAADPNYTITFVPGTLTITPAPPPVIVTAQLITKKVGKKKRLVIQVFENGTEKREFASPFQKPAFKSIQVGVRDGQIVLTARKGKKTLTQVFPG
jgi:hypothetical protein